MTHLSAFQSIPYQAILDTLPAHLCVLDQNGVILFVNQAWRTFARDNGGAENETCEGVNYLAICQEAGPENDEFATNLTQLLQGETGSFEHEYPCHSPLQQRWFSVLARRVPGEGCARFVITHNNITSRKRAQCQKQQTDHDIRLLVGPARCLLWSGTVTDQGAERLHWDIRFHDEEAARQFMPVARVRNHSFMHSWYLARPPEDRERTNELSLQKVLANESFSQEFRCRLADGSLRWLKEDIEVQKTGVGIWQVTGVCTDITERTLQAEILQEREQHFRLALEGGNLSSWHLDVSEKVFIHVSDDIKRDLGVSSKDSFTWEHFLRAIHPDDIPQVLDSLELALTTQKTTSVEFRVVYPDGTTAWLGSHGRAIPNERGKATQVIGVIRDITKRKQLEEEFARALEEAQARADRDPLTGLLNHRAFHKRLEEESARAQREGTNLAVVMLDLDNFKFFNDAYGHATGDQVLRQVAQRLQATSRAYDTLARFGGDEFAIILPGVGSTPIPELEERLRTDLRTTFQPDGAPVPIPISVSLGAALFTHQPPDGNVPRGWSTTLQLADDRLRRAKTQGTAEHIADQTRSQMSRIVEGFSMLDALVTAVDNKDRYTKRHSEDVLTYSLQIADELGIDDEQRQTVAAAALLHDVGKIGVPDAILRKPGTLTKDEFEAIKQHPTMGTAIVGAVHGLENTQDAIRFHHERWDGKGYPCGLAGLEIPWMARLLAVADAFSAMTTDRPYRLGMSPETARKILREGAGTQWDPEMVEHLIRSHEKATSLSSAPCVPALVNACL